MKELYKKKSRHGLKLDGLSYDDTTRMVEHFFKFFQSNSTWKINNLQKFLRTPMCSIEN